MAPGSGPRSPKTALRLEIHELACIAHVSTKRMRLKAADLETLENGGIPVVCRRDSKLDVTVDVLVLRQELESRGLGVQARKPMCRRTQGNPEQERLLLLQDTMDFLFKERDRLKQLVEKAPPSEEKEEDLPDLEEWERLLDASH